MPDKRSLFLFVSCWLLLAAVLLPSSASAAVVVRAACPGTITSDTFPIMQDPVVVRQAQLAYLTGKEQIGMQATIRYIASRNGSPATLTALAEKTETAAGSIGSPNPSAALLDARLQDLRELARQFRTETDRQMVSVNGNPDTLRTDIQSATDSSAVLQQLLDTYWKVRESTELADFDQQVACAQGTLGTLGKNGHEVAPAQEKLTEIITMRTELATALRSRNNAGIESAHKKIHTTSIEYARIIGTLKAAASSETRLGQTIDQGIGVITRSGMVNSNLEQTGVDTARARDLVTQGKTQILAAQNQCRGSNTDGCRASLAQFRKTLTSLRDTYRGILTSQDLPQATAQSVLSVAQSLDLTSAQVGAV